MMMELCAGGVDTMARVTVGGPHKRGGNMLHFTLQSKDSAKARH